jgi:rhodanese-related sulfurtransferase
MPSSVAPVTLARLREIGSRFALIDVREHGEFNAAHIPGASSVPRRLLESRLERLVPCKDVQLIFCDDNGPRAQLAARTAERMDYWRVGVLEGGVNAWASEGYPTEWGMNVPSKDFGERVEVENHVPTIEASELRRRQREGERLLILDTRTPEEYGQYCIPGGRSVPGGELALRITDILAAQPEKPDTIVINCAGRTRSIIGARVLQRMGVPNVVSLKNGTSGWVLAGLELEQGARRFELPEPGPEGLAAAEAFAERAAAEDGVKRLTIDELAELMPKVGQECIYLLDVRTEQEFAAGHIPGFWWFPGGQAVQRSDDTVAVRDATIVFCCDRKARSLIAASWYRQLGFPNVYAVDGGTAAWAAGGRVLEAGADQSEPTGLAAAAASVRQLSPTDLQARLGSEPAPLVLFVDTSREFAAGHVPGSRWLSRSWLEPRIGALAADQQAPIVLTDADGRSAPFAAAALGERGYGNVAMLAGGLKAWREAGLPLETGLSGVMAPPDDVVPAGPERSHADMMNYLRWEEALGRKYEASAH